MWFILVVLVILIALLIISYLLAKDLFESLFKRRETIPLAKDGDFKNYYSEIKANEKRIKSELVDVYIENDGIKLHGLFHQAESNVYVITLHDVHSNPILNNAIVNPYLIDAKYNTLMVDLRGHGKSEGEYVGFGVGDICDVRKWAEHVKELDNDAKIIIHGSGIGAYAAILACDIEHVKGIIADSPCLSAYEYLKNYFKANKMNKFPTIWFLKHIAKKKLNYDISLSAFEKIKHITTPIMLIHGKDDELSDPVNSAQLYQLCRSQKSIHVYQNSKHLMSYLDNKKEYKDRVIEFINKESKN